MKEETIKEYLARGGKVEVGAFVPRDDDGEVTARFPDRGGGGSDNPKERFPKRAVNSTPAHLKGGAVPPSPIVCIARRCGCLHTNRWCGPGTVPEGWALKQPFR